MTKSEKERRDKDKIDQLVNERLKEVLPDFLAEVQKHIQSKGSTNMPEMVDTPPALAPTKIRSPSIINVMHGHGGSPQSLEEEIPCTLLARVSTNGDLLVVAKARVFTGNVMHNSKCTCLYPGSENGTRQSVRAPEA
jgi:hypothetical protein